MGNTKESTRDLAGRQGNGGQQRDCRLLGAGFGLVVAGWTIAAFGFPDWNGPIGIIGMFAVAWAFRGIVDRKRSPAPQPVMSREGAR